ncbi:protein-tyrosine phosphatase [Globomyces pollinis-pini]|nr:protein-tyrosine phosphatase [Globomyces pollinis-pini]
MLQTKVLVPPLNFDMVAPGVYRSGYPNKKNFEFLKKLNLTSIMYICEDDYSQENLDYLNLNGIKIHHIKISGNKEPFVEIDQNQIAQALVTVLDERNLPILIHCNKGKHRVGCLIGCLRKLQRWSMASIFDEYRRFSGNKLRIADQEFIEIFNAQVCFDSHFVPKWL